MDQFYFEEGYLEASYFTVIREAEAALPMAVTVSALVDIADATGYYIPDYIVTDYFESGGQVREADAAFTVTVTQSVVFERITEAAATVSVTVTKTCGVIRIRDLAAAFTAAFAPTLTATAFKNHTAVLDSVSTMSVDAVANRSANVLLDYIADLNAMAAKTVNVVSTASTTATQSTAAVKTASPSISLSSSAAITCILGEVHSAQSQLSLLSLLKTSRYFGKNRPRNIVDYNDNPYFNFFASGLAGGQGISTGATSPVIFAGPLSDISPGANESWVLTFTYNNDGTTTARSFFYTFLNGSGSERFLRLATTNTAGTGFQLNLFKTGQSTVTQTFTTSGSATKIAISYHNGYAAVFLDGQRQALIDLTATTGVTWTGFNELIQTRWSLGANTSIDEFHYSRGTFLEYNPQSSTVTATNLQVNSPTTTEVLWHFDGNGLDDITVTESGAAALASVFTQQTIGSGTFVPRSAEASLSSTVIVSAQGDRPASAAADLVSATAVTAVFERTRLSDSNLNTVTAVTAVIGSVKQFDCDAGALFAPQITVTAQLAGVALLETTTTVTAQAVKITDVISSQAVTVDQTATITYTAGADLAVTVTADQTATATRIQTTAAVLECVASQVVEIDAINRVSADLVSVFAQTTQALRQRPGSAELSTAVELDAIIEFTHNTTVVIESTVVQTAINDRIRPVDVTAGVLTELTATAVKDTDVLSVQSVQAVLTSSAVKTTDVLVDNLVLFTSSFTADITARPLVFLETQSALTAIIGSIKEYVPNSNSGLRLPVQDVTLVMHPNNIAEVGFLLGSQSFPQGYAYNANTISVWIRQEVVGQGSWQLDSLEYTVPYNYGNVTVAQGNITVGDLGFGETININWSNVVPNDVNWHHVFLKYQTQAGFYGDGYRLWVDGVDKGYREFQSNEAGIITFVQEYGCRVGGGGYSVAQLRIGNDEITVNDVYDTSTDGFRDLGVTGRGAFDRLSIPGIYTEFDRPWTNIVNGQGAVITDFTNFAESQVVIAVPDMQANTRFVVGITTSVLGRTEVNVQTSLACTATAVFDTVLNLTVTVTETVTATTAIGIVADLPVVFAQDCTVFRIQTADSDLALAFTQTVQPGLFEQATADLVSTVILDAGVDSIPPTRGEAELSSSFQLTAQATSFTDSITLLVTAGTLTADVTLIPPIRVEADLVVTASMSVTIGSIEQFAVLSVSSGTLSCSAVKTTDSQSPLTVSVTQSTVSLKFTGIIANFTAFNTQLTVGEIINIDPHLQLKIEPETRINKIPQESRVFIIESETRVNIIKD